MRLIASFEGNTASHYAAVNNNYEVLSLLLLKGALMNVKNGEGKCPIDYTSDSTIERIIISKCSPHSPLTRSDHASVNAPIVPPFSHCPFQLASKCLLTLFSIGATVMKYVVGEYVDFPVYPFDLLTVDIAASHHA